jgi:hypothetical protein
VVLEEDIKEDEAITTDAVKEDEDIKKDGEIMKDPVKENDTEQHEGSQALHESQIFEDSQF